MFRIFLLIELKYNVYVCILYDYGYLVVYIVLLELENDVIYFELFLFLIFWGKLWNNLELYFLYFSMNLVEIDDVFWFLVFVCCILVYIIKE